MKVAYYSPLPPSRSGIADYSALLLPALRERVDVVVAPHAKELARACSWLLGHHAEARAFGRAGREVASAVTWDACIDRLLAAVA